MTPKDFFLQIGVMLTLYVSAVSLITLLFQVINVLHPDQLYGGYGDLYSSGIRWAIASLIIIFPLFILLSWLISRDYATMPEKRGLSLRRWLIVLTLFFAGAAIATDLIILINSFLSGEITTRFVLKIFVVLLVSGMIFGYYLWDLRRSAEATANNRSKTFAIVAMVIVLASVIGGFLIMGSPATQRKVVFDEQKITDMMGIQWQIISYWQRKQTLPTELGLLNDSLNNFRVPTDPQTNQPYGYRKTGNNSFELCADFNLDSATSNKTIPIAPFGDQNNWNHPAGRSCFNRTIDPQLYPQITNPKF